MNTALTRRGMLGGAASVGAALVAGCGIGTVGTAGGGARNTGSGEARMTPQLNKNLWKPWVALWNGDLAAADAIIAPDFVAHFAPAGASPGEVRGPEGLKRWIAGTLAAFADHGFSTDIGPLADGDKVVGRWVFRGTYRGGIPGSPPAAIGKRVEYAGVDILRIEADKIAEYWLSADILQLLQQVEAIPS
jgi:predicted ester cyclase